jgi:hypothetical protein
MLNLGDFMKKLLLFSLLPLLFLSGCSIIKNGNDLSGFIFRMNEQNESYNMTEKGFLYNKENSEFYKFFIINENEILLSLKSDEKGRLTELNITTSCCLNENELLLSFVTDTLYCFINNNETTESLLNETDFNNNIITPKKETIKVKNGNTELLLDVTEIGTVITVYNDCNL